VLKDNWGRFTARGGEAVEIRLTNLVDEVATVIDKVLPKHSYRAVALIGGYGRGEGGVECCDGKELPHNNLDFLIVFQGQNSSQRENFKVAIDKKLKPIAQREGLGLDLGTTTVESLKHSPCLVMWYDMRFGHKTVLGDADFIPSLTHFAVEKVEPSDIRNLLVNRGSLFLINEMLLEKSDLSVNDQRTIVKHAVKGIIGCGDALLYFLGDYHWSYLEKQRRMQQRQDVPSAFKALYDSALNFRFTPDYVNYPGQDINEWSKSVHEQLNPVHLQCEAMRLSEPDLTWEDYAQKAMKFTLMESPLSLKAWARKARNILQSPAAPSGSILLKMGFKVNGMRGVMPVLFPLIAYHLCHESYLALTKEILQSPDTNNDNLRRAYLKAWGTYGDTNFSSVLEKLGISLNYKTGVEL